MNKPAVDGGYSWKELVLVLLGVFLVTTLISYAFGFSTMFKQLFVRESCREIVRPLDDSSDFTCRGKIDVIKTDTITFLRCRCPQ